ncbi:low temperature requirement protein A [Micromonospora sp. NBC_01796]|uniref:low temperature requirement protein A n=1 Tax=Micromonospora sp. NBC_01796 TaxID=2975987 RepID=UPI002DD7A985|nr:low temperature requirement protein A [Micromonospora sp. NBC_01796]WSA89473.1 low temperature requirement protein A [Micromonospora sp. NBC_01796]
MRVLRGAAGRGQVTFVELFFDLIYVLGVTQLTHLLITHLTPLGALQTLLLLLALWFAWVDTSWVTNWFDPNQLGVRLMLVVLMLLSLIISASVPEAYGQRGIWVAGAYAAIQVGRNVFVVLALGRAGADESPEQRSQRLGLRLNFERLLLWKSVSSALWVAGGLSHGSVRLMFWAIAVVIEYCGAAAGFYVPRLGRSTPADWHISGRHLAERGQLFILIALGESILITGTVFGERPAVAPHLLAFVVSFLGSVALWWLYFDRSAEAASAVIDQSEDPGRIGRSAFTYFQLPMVAGIIVAAVGDELVIAHPDGHSGWATIVTVLGGPALFLAGHALFKHSVFGGVSKPRVVAFAVLAALVPVGLVVPPLVLSLLATLVVAGVGVWDSLLPAHHAPATT